MLERPKGKFECFIRLSMHFPTNVILSNISACGEYPIRFFARDSGLLKFRICPGLQDRRSQPSRRLVAFTFHPYEPFAISVQRIDNDYVVNFHIRNCETVVAK